MSNAELIADLRGKGFGVMEKAADRIEALTADLARSTRLISKMVPLSACGNYVFWDGVGDIELDHNGELRKTIEALEAKLGEQNLLWQAYDGDLYQAYVDANEARIDAEAKLAECLERNALLEARLGKAVEALEALIQLAHDCEKELTEDLHHIPFCGESKPLTNARATLAEIKSSFAAPPYGLEGESHE